MLVDDVSANYAATSAEYRALRQTLERVEKLRSALDSAVYREHVDACAHVYYGESEDELPHTCSTSNRSR